MKKILLPILFLYLTHGLAQDNASSSQIQVHGNGKRNADTTYSVTQSIFDVNTSLPSSVRSNGQIYLAFYDVNPYLYSANLREIQRDIVNDEDLSTKSLVVDRPNNYTFSTIRLQDFRLPEVSTSPSIKEFEQLGDQIDLILANMEAFQVQIRELKERRNTMIRSGLNTRSEANRSLEIVTSPPQEVVELDSILDSLNQKMATLQNELIELQRSRDRIIRESHSDELNFKRFNDAIRQYIEILYMINDKRDLYNELILLVHSNKRFSEIQAAKQSILNSHFNAVVDPNVMLRNSNELFTDLSRLYNEVTSIYSNTNDKSKIDSAFTTLKNYHSKLDLTQMSELDREIMKVCYSITEQNWKVTYQTTTISPKADKIAYHVEFTPKTNSFSQFGRPLKFDYNFDVRGGTKIDVSAGILFHVGLSDDSYSLRKLTDTTTLIVLEEKTRVTPTIGALLNIYKRSNSNVKFALNIGTGTDIQKIFYYTGVSLLLGKGERAGIGIGCVGGHVKKLSRFYTKNDEGNIIINRSIDEVVPDVVMRETFRLGGYFTITYNLTGRNRETMEQGIRK